MSKNVLITGGAGFIGSNLAQKLCTKGYNVRVLDNLSEQIHGKDAEIPDSIKGKVDFIKGSVTDIEVLREAIKDMEVVVHLAAETGTGQSIYEISKYTDVNIGGTAKLLDIIVNEKTSVNKIIVASSRAVYGEGAYKCMTDGVVYPDFRKNIDMEKGDFQVKCPKCGKNVEVVASSEESRLHPSSVYGITKQAQEELVLTLCDGMKISAMAYRFQNVYGPGQSLINPYTGIISIFSNLILNGEEINIFEDGKESRDFVYIDDVTDALLAGVELKDFVNETINVGTGKMTTVEEVVHTLMKCYGKEVPYKVTGMYRVGDIRHNYSDISKARMLLGYEPKVSFEEGIGRFVDWARNQGEHSIDYKKSLQEMSDRGLFK